MSKKPTGAPPGNTNRLLHGLYSQAECVRKADLGRLHEHLEKMPEVESAYTRALAAEATRRGRIVDLGVAKRALRADRKNRGLRVAVADAQRALEQAEGRADKQWWDLRNRAREKFLGDKPDLGRIPVGTTFEEAKAIWAKDAEGADAEGADPDDPYPDLCPQGRGCKQCDGRREFFRLEDEWWTAHPEALDVQDGPSEEIEQDPSKTT